MIAAVKTTEAEESGKNMFSGLSLVQNDLGSQLPLTSSNVQMATDMSIISKFPTVPTAPIVIESNSSATLRRDEQPTLPKEVARLSEIDLTSSSFSGVKEVVKKKPANFSTLYAAEVRNFDTPQSVSLYPELPSITHRGYEEKIKDNRSYHFGGENLETENEYSSLIDKSHQTNTINNYPVVPQQYVPQTHPHYVPHVQPQFIPPQSQSQYVPLPTQSATIERTNDDSSSLLVNELVQENSRLLDEVNSLKKIIAMAENNKTSANVDRTTPATSSAEQKQTVGTKISDPSVRPKEGVKYVCCGACRQWLMAPRDVVYVVCVGCRAVNNCNLTTPTTNAAAATSGMGTEAETRALQANNSTPSWLGALDCFTKPFR